MINYCNFIFIIKRLLFLKTVLFSLIVQTFMIEAQAKSSISPRNDYLVQSTKFKGSLKCCGNQRNRKKISVEGAWLQCHCFKTLLTCRP